MGRDFCIVTIESCKITTMTPFVKMLWGLKDGRYKIEANTYSQRTLPQNRYYWGLVIPMIQQGLKDMGTEVNKEEVHEFLKSRFNYQEVINKGTGEYVTIPKSTAGLNKEQFSQYIEKIQQFASEFLNIVIPDPNTQMAIEY